MTADQAALLDHIRAENAKIQAWINAAPGRGAGIISEDLEMWAEDGVHTVDDFIRYDLAITLYDYIKYEHGYKRNWSELFSMTVEELKNELNAFGVVIRYPWA